MNDLVQRLSTGEHRVEVDLKPEKTMQAFQECLNRGYVHIRFPDTRGGTTLGVKLDNEACDLGGMNRDTGTGTAKLVGGLTLDYVKVRCVADIDLQLLNGKGHLEVIEAAGPAN